MTCGRHKPKFRTKAMAKRHGAITYGYKDFYVRKVKGGWKAYKK